MTSPHTLVDSIDLSRPPRSLASRSATTSMRSTPPARNEHVQQARHRLGAATGLQAPVARAGRQEPCALRGTHTTDAPRQRHGRTPTCSPAHGDTSTRFEGRVVKKRRCSRCRSPMSRPTSSSAASNTLVLIGSSDHGVRRRPARDRVRRERRRRCVRPRAVRSAGGGARRRRRTPMSARSQKSGRRRTQRHVDPAPSRSRRCPRATACSTRSASLILATKAMGAERPACSSFHHQAIDTAGRVETAGPTTARSRRCERPRHGCRRGQWHPEGTAAEDPHQQRLFDDSSASRNDARSRTVTDQRAGPGDEGLRGGPTACCRGRGPRSACCATATIGSSPLRRMTSARHAGVGGVAPDSSSFAFSGAPTSRKARNMHGNPQVTFHGAVECISVEGRARTLAADLVDPMAGACRRSTSPTPTSNSRVGHVREVPRGVGGRARARAFAVIEHEEDFTRRRRAGFGSTSCRSRSQLAGRGRTPEQRMHGACRMRGARRREPQRCSGWTRLELARPLADGLTFPRRRTAHAGAPRDGSRPHG